MTTSIIQDEIKAYASAFIADFDQVQKLKVVFVNPINIKPANKREMEILI